MSNLYRQRAGLALDAGQHPMRAGRAHSRYGRSPYLEGCVRNLSDLAASGADRGGVCACVGRGRCHQLSEGMGARAVRQKRMCKVIGLPAWIGHERRCMRRAAEDRSAARAGETGASRSVQRRSRRALPGGGAKSTAVAPAGARQCRGADGERQGVRCSNPGRERRNDPAECFIDRLWPGDGRLAGIFFMKTDPLLGRRSVMRREPLAQV